MGCFTHRRKQTSYLSDQKWDYITLADFKARGCAPGFFYCYLWFSLLLSIAVYAVDSFTAVNLLAFNRWSSKITPTIPFDVSKWIFSGCIIASFVNLIYEGIRAMHVMKRGNVAECYMDSLAARWESIRFGSGQGWRRFLVFTELTKSKKGAEYIALFSYFSLQTWFRVVLCSGPRQVVNAFTIKSVYEAKLAPTADSVEASVVGLFNKIKALATEDYQQAVILSGMCFTLVVWVFSALFLLAAIFFYVFFLFHWIPRADGGLTGYCERKVNQRLTRIVTKKVNKALAKGQAKRAHGHDQATRNGEKWRLDRDSTLPTLPDVGKDDGLPMMPSLARTNSGGSLPPMYSTRPGTPASIELSAMSAYSAKSSLVGNAAEMGHSRESPEPYAVRARDFNAIAPPRPGTSSSTSSSQASISMASRPGLGRLPPAARTYEAYNPDGRASPADMTSYQNGRAMAPPFQTRGLQYAPQRNVSSPVPGGAAGGGYYERSATPQSMRGARPQQPYGGGYGQ